MTEPIVLKHALNQRLNDLIKKAATSRLTKREKREAELIAELGDFYEEK